MSEPRATGSAPPPGAERRSRRSWADIVSEDEEDDFPVDGDEDADDVGVNDAGGIAADDDGEEEDEGASEPVVPFEREFGDDRRKPSAAEVAARMRAVSKATSRCSTGRGSSAGRGSPKGCGKGGPLECYICGEDHHVRDCPHKRRGGRNRGKEGDGKGGRGGKGDALILTDIIFSLVTE